MSLFCNIRYVPITIFEYTLASFTCGSIREAYEHIKQLKNIHHRS